LYSFYLVSDARAIMNMRRLLERYTTMDAPSERPPFAPLIAMVLLQLLPEPCVKIIPIECMTVSSMKMNHPRRKADCVIPKISEHSQVMNTLML
jgi:hypothetical protein